MDWKERQHNEDDDSAHCKLFWKRSRITKYNDLIEMLFMDFLMSDTRIALGIFLAMAIKLKNWYWSKSWNQTQYDCKFSSNNSNYNEIQETKEQKFSTTYEVV